MMLIHTGSLVTRRAKGKCVFKSAVATLAADSIERCGDDPNVYLRIVASLRIGNSRDGYWGTALCVHASSGK